MYAHVRVYTAEAEGLTRHQGGSEVAKVRQTASLNAEDDEKRPGLCGRK